MPADMARSRIHKAGRRRPQVLSRNAGGGLKSCLAVVALILLSAIAILLAVGIVKFVQISRELPSVADIANFAPEESTKIYYADTDADGKPKLMAVLAAANRKPVKLSEISKHLIHATIAVEDARFYQHHGVDYIGIARALFRNITGGNIAAQGASTLTQQLARSVEALGIGRKKRLDRKLREVILARRIEEMFSKDEILELYLNTVYYGNGAYGAEAAALAYFGKRAARLTLSEAAYLAGLPQRPVYYSHDSEAAMRRRDIVLDRMVEAGYITPLQRDEARMADLRPRRRSVVTGYRIYGSPYVVDYVIQVLRREYGPDKAQSGLRVYTTIDSRMQELAEEVLRDGVRRSGYANQGCLVSMEAQTGYIRAMVGGLNYRRDQFNVVTQGLRQPGSAFKPIVYTAAIDTGVCTLDSRFRDDPNFPWRGRDKWIPQNYGGRYSYASVTVRDAIRRSLNTIAVKVAIRTGIPVVIEYARKMGITTDLAPYPPLALGASAVRPLELCVAYSVFANGGRRVKPLCVYRVLERDGTLLDEFTSEDTPTGIQPGTLDQMNEALRAVVTSGTATAASSIPEARGKTGTTNDNRDAWFAGYTPELTTVVWVAREQRTNGRVRYLEMPGGTGGRLCAPIWRDFMRRAVNLLRETKEREAQRAAEEAPPPKKTEEERMEEPIQPAPQPDEAVPEIGEENEPAPAEQPTAQPAPTVENTPPPAQPVPATRLDRPQPPRPDPGAEIIRVRICAETGNLATPYCPVTIERSLPRRDVPRLCPFHKPPPGEPR